MVPRLGLVVSPFSFLTKGVHSEQSEEVRDETEALSETERTEAQRFVRQGMAVG